MTRVVHYLNQFFVGIGGEDAASSGPGCIEGAVGPGRKLQALLGDDYEIVATVHCGDDHAAAVAGAAAEIVALARGFEPDVIVAGPSFTSGRYGIACARVVAAATDSGLPAVAAMHDDNPGLEDAANAIVVRSGEVAREMGPSLEVLAAAVRRVALDEPVTAEHGRIGRVPRRNVVVDATAAERAVDLVMARLAGGGEAEVPLPRFDRVTPAPPVPSTADVTVAFVTEGALVPDANPDGLESARASRWLRYSIEGADALPAGEYRSVHGGFSTVWANEDPHRILPLDVARELEREQVVGRLHPEYFVTVGNGTSVGNARRFGVEWAAELRRSGVRAAVFTAT